MNKIAKKIIYLMLLVVYLFHIHVDIFHLIQINVMNV